MEVSRSNSAQITTGPVLAGLAVFLIGTWSPQVIGASWSESDCSESADDIQPEMTLDGLTLDPVDHPAIEPTHSEIDQAAVESANKEQVTPFLYLAPRVASVLKDVFGEDQEQADVVDAPSSPLAERDEVSPYPAPVDNDLPESEELDGSSLQLLHRQMYRIDI